MCVGILRQFNTVRLKHAVPEGKDHCRHGMIDYCNYYSVVLRTVARDRMYHPLSNAFGFCILHAST